MFLLMGILYNFLALMFLIVFSLIAVFFSTILNNYDVTTIMKISVLYEKQKDKIMRNRTRLQIYFKFFKYISLFLPYVYVFIACYTFLEMLYKWSKSKTFLEYIFKDYFELEANDFKDLEL